MQHLSFALDMTHSGYNPFASQLDTSTMISETASKRSEHLLL
jgi:hypothetical protein